MRAVPVWAVATAAAAPVLLVTGWTVAGARQPPGYDPVRDTLSELASPGATDRWIMSGCLVLLGCCYLATAAVLHAAGLPARFLLGVGGAATVALIAVPRPPVGGSPAHGTVATVAVLALVFWPAGTALGLPRAAVHAAPPWAFRRPVALTATALLLVLFGWFVAEVTDGSRTGLAERVTAVAVALWPLLAVLSARRAHRRWSAGPPPPTRPVSPGRPAAGG